MPTTCQNCQTNNLDGAHFCQSCGSTLGATQVQGRTVVSTFQPPPAQCSPQQIATIVQRATAAFGQAASVPVPVSAQRHAQREHTVFVVDSSGSMSERYDGGMNKLDATIRANSSMVLNKARIDPEDEIGLVMFRSHAQVLQPLVPLGTHKRDVIAALQQLSPNNGTNINEGLKAARDTFDWSRGDVVRRIVLLTDGHGGRPLRTAEDLKSRGVVMDVIGVGDSPSNVDEKLLKKVASVIEGELRYQFIKDQQTLVNHYTQLANKTATTP